MTARISQKKVIGPHVFYPVYTMVKSFKKEVPMEPCSPALMVWKISGYFVYLLIEPVTIGFAISIAFNLCLSKI